MGIRSWPFIFQSTLPAWGATRHDRKGIIRIFISIHAPRMGSDRSRVEQHIVPQIFQSTLPAWGATVLPDRFRGFYIISIHAPRMGSDMCTHWVKQGIKHFNPRSPHGERHDVLDRMDELEEFQSTLPAWGATDAYP